MAKAKKTDILEQQVGELTADVQRVRADFENYRKRVDTEKQAAREAGAMSSITKLLPVIDTIERAVSHVPDDLAGHSWVKGITGLEKQLTKQLKAIHVTKIVATPGTEFNPELHQAVQFDESSEGDTEVIAEELQPGYLLHGTPLRHAMVKVARR